MTRGMLNGRFGWIGNEKPIPDDMKPDTDKERNGFPGFDQPETDD